MTDQTHAAGLEALETLRLMIANDKVSDASRVSAARALLDRLTPGEDAERQRRETDERNAAIAEARGLMAAFASAAAAGLSAPPALAEDREAGTIDAPCDAG